MTWECGLTTREKEPEPKRDRKRQLTKDPRRRTTSAPRHPAASLVYTSLPGNVGFQESATTSEGTGKGVQWGSELSLCRTSCQGLEVVLLLGGSASVPNLISQGSHHTGNQIRPRPGSLSRLLGSGTGPSGGHKGTVGSPGKPPRRDGPSSTPDFGARIPRS